MDDDKLLKVKDVAKYLQMNRMTIYKLAKSGKLPCIKIGSEWRFPKSGILKLLDLQESSGKTVEKMDGHTLEGKGKVLIVDDDPGIRDLFVKILKNAGLTSYEVKSGEECMEFVKKNKPDVILLDLKMADMDGVDTLRLIKQYDKNIVVILVTAYATINTAIEAMKLGAFDYIAKPFDNDKIISLVEKALKTTTSLGLGTSP